MYSHVREVFLGLILIAVAAVASGVLAFVAPFQDSWSAWGGMAVASVLAVITSLGVSATASREEDFWGLHALVLFMVIPMIGGFAIAAIFDIASGAEPIDAGAAWATFGTLMSVYAVTALVDYVAAATEAKSSSGLRRVA